MTTFQNHEAVVTATLYRNMLVSVNGQAIAILLGHCLFNSEGKVTGKYFKNTLYNLKGEILAKESTRKPPVMDDTKIQNEGWLIIMQIKDHICPRIEPLQTWAKESIEKHFGLERVGDVLQF